jgi:hypothetical protein
LTQEAKESKTELNKAAEVFTALAAKPKIKEL